MKGVYLGACRAYHRDYNLDYNDIVPGYHINLLCDMLSVDLSKYDFILASPPCNYYSRANYRRDSSEYSLMTRGLLPKILEKCSLSGKPFIVENVRSPKLFRKMGVDDICLKYGIVRYIIGRHTYFTNIMCNLNCKQELDFHSKNVAQIVGYSERQSYRQGGDNVERVFNIWLEFVCESE